MRLSFFLFLQLFCQLILSGLYSNNQQKNSRIPMYGNVWMFGSCLDEIYFKHYTVLSYSICPGGEVGRHARFRFWCRKVCRFESYPGHITERFVRNGKMFGFFMPKFLLKFTYEGYSFIEPRGSIISILENQ